MKSQMFESILNDAIMGIAVFKFPFRQCEYLNKKARESLELAPDAEAQSLSVQDLFAEKGRENLRPLQMEILEREGLSQDLIIRKMNGSILIADVGVKHIESEGSQYLVLMFRDVTFQKKLQRDLTLKQAEIQTAYQELMEQNKALMDLDRAKDKFVALTTHELRTPLSAMIATSEVLSMKLYDNDTQRDEFIKTVYEEGLHLLEIVNDILDFSKIQAGKMDFYVECLEPAPIVKKLVENFSQMADTKKLKITVEIPNPQLQCYFDPMRLKQVFNNVLSNAIKFTHPSTEIKVRILEVDKRVRLEIEDKGPGIPNADSSKVFNEFETVGQVNSHHKGTGLGMPISKKLMERMGGTISFTSTVDVGTTFILTLPIEKILDAGDYRSRPAYSDDLAA